MFREGGFPVKSFLSNAECFPGVKTRQGALSQSKHCHSLREPFTEIFNLSSEPCSKYSGGEISENSQEFSYDEEILM